MDFMHQLVQQLINGVSLGSIYALIALGYTMIYGIIKLINFAHGDVYMVGAYIGFAAVTIGHLSTFNFNGHYGLPRHVGRKNCL